MLFNNYVSMKQSSGEDALFLAKNINRYLGKLGKLGHKLVMLLFNLCLVVIGFICG